MTELFPESSVTKLSPRFVWLKRHNLALGELPDGTRFCVGREAIGFAETHSDAEQSCAADIGIEHWTVEEFKKAGVVMPEKAQQEEW